MKHTLKSLLITSVLTVPSAFGSNGIVTVLNLPVEHSQPGGADARERVVVTKESSAVTTAPVPTPESIVSLCDRAYALEKTGDSKAAANVYLDSLNDQNTSWFKVLFVALRLEQLEFLDLAIRAYQQSMHHATTKLFCKRALAEIDRLELLSLTKHNQNDNADATAALSQAQGHEPHSANPMMLQTFTDMSFDELFGFVFENPDKAADVLSQHMSLSDTQKTILKGLLPGATLLDIYNAADLMSQLGSNYYDRAAGLYEQSTDHKDVKSLNIRKAADLMSQLGSNYYDRAAVLYEQSANHPNTTSEDIGNAAQGMSKLGTKYHDKAAVLYEQSANHKTATSWNIRNAADLMSQLGTKYHDRAAPCYIKNQ